MYAAPVGATPVATASLAEAVTSVVFHDLPVGAYLIVAAGDKTTYTTLVAETYDGDETYMTAEDVTVVAKASGYFLDKVVNDEFVYTGQVLNFTVNTTFPNFDTISEDSTFIVTDTPTNLNIDVETVKAYIAGVKLTGGYTASVGTDGVLTVNFSQLINNNANAGKSVTIEYQAMVTGTTKEEEAFKNIVVSTRNDKILGTDSTKGYTGDIEVTKTDDTEERNELSGAAYELYEVTASENSETESGKILVSFVKLGKGEYRRATGEDSDVVTTLETEDLATLKVTGLDEGTYWFKEVKAPAGYSINEDGVTVEVEANTTEHVSETATLMDTKLIELPSTGGVGTTIFTVGGCAVMIGAAFLFFVNRRKEESK